MHECMDGLEKEVRNLGGTVVGFRLWGHGCFLGEGV